MCNYMITWLNSIDIQMNRQNVQNKKNCNQPHKTNGRLKNNNLSDRIEQRN